MTREEAEKLIYKSVKVTTDEYKQNYHLHLVLVLMYYYHFTEKDAMKFSFNQIKGEDNGGYIVTPHYEKRKCTDTYKVDEWGMDWIKDYKQRYKVGSDEQLIQIGERAVRYAFKAVARFCHVEGQLKDVRTAGLTDIE